MSDKIAIPVYQHYKTKIEYLVLALGQSEGDPTQELVIYTKLGDWMNEPVCISNSYARSKAEFVEVMENGQPRFKITKCAYGYFGVEGNEPISELLLPEIVFYVYRVRTLL